MRITVECIDGVLKILEVHGEPPLEGPVTLYTEGELLKLSANLGAELDLQGPSFVRGDEDEDARELF
ncbi:MAG: hypothetical protein SNJ84_06265 [Verrucomicrobiia bacterium]